MKITREGWHRNHGEHPLAERALSEARLGEDGDAIGYDEWLLTVSSAAEDRRGAGRVNLLFRVDTSDRPMNGEYLLRASFSRQDLALMFAKSLRGVSFEAAIAELWKAVDRASEVDI